MKIKFKYEIGQVVEYRGIVCTVCAKKYTEREHNKKISYDLMAKSKGISECYISDANERFMSLPKPKLTLVK